MSGVMSESCRGPNGEYCQGGHDRHPPMRHEVWVCRSLFGMKCTPTENDGRDHDRCGITEDE